MQRDRLQAPTPGPLAESDHTAQVIRAAQAGDPAAIDELLAVLTPPLLRAGRALIGPKSADLDDLVQEVLIAVVDALPSFRGECTLLHFAIRIATRRATTVRRRSRSILRWLEELCRREQPLLLEPSSPRDEAVADRRRLLLRTLLGEIPEAQAEALVLRVALGYALDEVATITRTPVNTVRSRLRLAKEALRARIGADPRWDELGEERRS